MIEDWIRLIILSLERYIVNENLHRILTYLNIHDLLKLYEYELRYIHAL